MYLGTHLLFQKAKRKIKIPFFVTVANREYFFHFSDWPQIALNYLRLVYVWSLPDPVGRGEGANTAPSLSKT